MDEATEPDDARVPIHSSREREVFRYLEPWEATIRPTGLARSVLPTVNDGEHASLLSVITTPEGCDDTALAAFAQLGALRLNAQRCMISLVSHEVEYLLAESTRTLSLQSDATHNSSDALCLGTTRFPRSQGFADVAIDEWCTTRGVRARPQEVDHYYTDSLSVHWHILSDLRQHKQLQERLFFKIGNTLRFYCAVPIRSPSGRAIGCYAVLDDKPRYGVSDDEMTFMEDMADTIMAHLEAKRAISQRQRGDRLIKGLALFNAGKTTLREWWMLNQSRRRNRGQGHRRQRGRSSDGCNREEQADEEFGMQYNANELDARGRLIPRSRAQAVANEDHADPVADKPRHHQRDTGAPEDISNNTGPARIGIMHQGLDSKAFNLQHQTENVFARASNLIREAINTDGVLVVDTDFSNVKRPGWNHHSDNRRNLSPTSSETPESGRDLSQDSTSSSTRRSTRPADEDASRPTDESSANSCSLLGFSTKIKSSIRGFHAPAKHLNISNAFMERLLRRYPHGKVFNFNDGRSLHSSSDGTASAGDTDVSVGTVVNKRRKRTTKAAQDAAVLADVFPEMRSILFLPLWDSQRGRWRAGAFVWNDLSNRFLDVDEDLTYLAAFGNSIMAELTRLDAVAADEAKATFISSISHELRSPLHGVLAGVEFLQESSMTPYQEEMTMTISMAGKTLLDTINHILDFSKISSFTDTQHADRAAGDLAQSNTSRDSNMGEIGVTDVVDLALLTENVVETVVAANKSLSAAQSPQLSYMNTRVTSGTYPSPMEASSDQSPSVILDISRQASWRLKISPGSWTRIITNLLGNALKYTKTGYVHVQLHVDDERMRKEIVLTIEDTGQGMSEEFLKHHLYIPFMQEDTHAVGTGLGLSIVKQIVNQLRGRIDVRSTVGQGTKVMIIIPGQSLLEGPPSDGKEVDTDIFTASKFGRSIKLGLLEPQTSTPQNERVSLTQDLNARRNELLRSSISNTSTDWLGCTEATYATVGEARNMDICIMTESDFSHWPPHMSGASSSGNGEINDMRRPIIVLSLLSEPAARRNSVEGLQENAIFISQPFGPRKLSRAFASAFNEDHRNSTSECSRADHTSSIAVQGPPSSTSDRPQRPGMYGRGGSSFYGRAAPSIAPSSPRSIAAVVDTQDISPAIRNLQAALKKEPQGRRGRKILLVEDNLINMKLLVAVMDKLNRQFETAANGLEAVQHYKREPRAYILILLDMSMPVMDGFTAAEHIRDHERKNDLGRCPIFALTGVASEEARKRAFSSGVDLFLPKPASMQKLRAIVEQLDEV